MPENYLRLSANFVNESVLTCNTTRWSDQFAAAYVSMAVSDAGDVASLSSNLDTTSTSVALSWASKRASVIGVLAGMYLKVDAEILLITQVLSDAVSESSCCGCDLEVCGITCLPLALIV